MRITLLSLTALLFVAFTAAAQNKDLVVTAAGDTLRCEITHPFLGNSTKYRTSKDEKPVKITIDKIKAYYDADRSEWLRRIYYKGRPSFMTVVESGKINLYQIIETYTGRGANGYMYTSSNKVWYVTKGNDTATLIKGDLSSRKNRKNEFAELLADNKAVYDMYMAYNGLAFDKLRNLVHLYNTGQPLSQ